MEFHCYCDDCFFLPPSLEITPSRPKERIQNERKTVEAISQAHGAILHDVWLSRTISDSRFV